MRTVQRSFSIRCIADRLRRSSSVLSGQSTRCVFFPPLSCLISKFGCTVTCTVPGEPAIVPVMARIDAGSMSNGHTHPFTNVQAYQPTSNTSNTSVATFSPAAPALRPQIYITYYFAKKTAHRHSLLIQVLHLNIVVSSAKCWGN